MSRLFAGPGEALVSTTAIPVSVAPWTMACWFRSTDLTAIQVLGLIGLGGVQEWLMQLDGTTGGDPLQFRIEDAPSPSLIINTSNGYTSGTWHHACFVEASSTSHRVILDGDFANEGSSAVPMTPTPSTIFAISRGTMVGEVAHMAFWDVALSNNEIAALANRWSPQRIRRDNLIDYWPINGDRSPEPDIFGSIPLSLLNAPVKGEEPPMFNRIVAA